MRLEWALFIILIGMCAVVGVAFLLEEVPFVDVPATNDAPAARVYQGHGIAHSEYATLVVGGEGAARQDRVVWLGWIFGMLQIAFFLIALAFGGAKAGKVGRLAKPIAGFGAVYAVVFTAMIVSHRAYTHTDDPGYFLNLPMPTAWMIYGVWMVPLVFAIVYMVKFDSWMFTEADRERFEAILAEYKNEES